MNLRQKELREWQERNFPRSKYDHLTRDELVDMIITMQCTLGIAEEAGEVCHHILKATQGIRDGRNGIDKEEIADGVTDTTIYGLQLLSQLGINADDAMPPVIDTVLARDWLANKDNGVAK